LADIPVEGAGELPEFVAGTLGHLAVEVAVTDGHDRFGEFLERAQEKAGESPGEDHGNHERDSHTAEQHMERRGGELLGAARGLQGGGIVAAVEFLDGGEHAVERGPERRNDSSEPGPPACSVASAWAA